MEASDCAPDPDLSPEDEARLARWERAGRPLIPLVTDGRGVVHATTDRLRTILRGRNPRMALFREQAVRWADEHCTG